MQPHNFSCWNLSGDHFLSCFFPLVAVPEAPPHLAAALGSGRPSGPGLPAQAHWDDSSSAAPMWHLKHHCTCCFCVFPQPPETWKSSRTIFTRALARTSPGRAHASVHLTTQGKRMNVCLILFLNFIQQKISPKAECFCWYLMTQTPFSLQCVRGSVVPASFQPNGL